MTYLLRLNLDIVGNHPDRSPRFKTAVRALKSVSKNNNKVIILAHRGRPKGKDKFLSLKVFTKHFYHALGKKVKFISNFDFKEIKKLIDSAPNGSIFLLENLRFLPGETKNSMELARKIASLGNRYINDDFPTIHHKNASNYALPSLLPSSMGIELKHEIDGLKKVNKPVTPSVVIIGGAKIKDKLGVIENLLPKVDLILLGGGVANTMLKARGVRIGKSLYDKDVIKSLGKLAKEEKIVTPVDWEIKKDMILDIGPQTIKEYKTVISKAKTIIWNGPMGLFEEKPFDRGTRELAKVVLGNKKAYVVIGGGDTIAALKIDPESIKNPKILISNGGGAMLNYLAGKKMSGIEILK